MPLNLAVFGSNRAADVIKDHPEVPRWAIGGHSLGGSMAAQFEIDHPSTTTGIVFLASYPAGNELSTSTMDALSIFASEDGLIPLTKWETLRPRFPKVTQWKLIRGGNHAGFGWYGAQKGDNPASIPLEEQTGQLVESIDEFLHYIDYPSK
jgi:pimeloyl-ACP methyl ester carboxylesterase